LLDSVYRRYNRHIPAATPAALPPRRHRPTLMRQDILALRRLVEASQDLVDAARPALHSQVIGIDTAPPMLAEQNASA